MGHHLRLVCLRISDREGYATYRRNMAPILERHGGRFVLDIEGRATLHPAGFEPDRVLLIAFSSPEAAARFFQDPAYVALRKRWFDTSVQETFAMAL